MIEQQVFQDVRSFRVQNDILAYQTSNAPQFIDITDDISAAIDRAEIRNGLVVVFSMHTTAAIKINESEPELIKDMCRFLCETAPLDRDYFHNNFDVRTVNMEEDECPNAHSHCQHLMLSASETIPIVNGRLCTGRWQRIFLIELDRPKDRRVSLQILGM